MIKICVVMLLLVTLFSCSGIKFQKNDYDNFWQFTSYKPNDVSDIIGTYIQSSGFHGEKLILNQDSTFYFSWFSHLYDPNVPHASKGWYYINNDTLILEAQEVIYDSSLQNQRSILVERISPQDVEQTKESQKKYGLNYVFKRIGDNIYLVRIRYKELWGEFSLENGGFPPMSKYREKTFSTFFLLKGK